MTPFDFFVVVILAIAVGIYYLGKKSTACGVTAGVLLVAGLAIVVIIVLVLGTTVNLRITPK